MTLIPLWTGNITLPALPAVKMKVGDNFIYQQPSRPLETKVLLFPSQHNSHDILTTELPAPFDKVAVRRKGTRKRDLGIPVIICCEDVEITSWNRQTEFVWEDTAPISEFIDVPEKIREGWQGKFVFQIGDDQKDLPGLRRPQVGALHAISAHFAVGKNHEEATVVLPTGTGKTETMLASLVYNRPEKLLVLVPSDALRGQISKKFIELGILREAFCIPEHTINPRVAVLRKGLKSVDEAEEIARATNVIVALPNTLIASEEEAVAVLCNGCSDLFVDEAHHVTANTWQAVKNRFSSGKITQFTATPFRRDRKHIGGKIIFNYKLSDAQEDGYYKPIRLITVEEFGEESKRNRAIAEKAVAILRDDLGRGFDHLLMARVKDTSKVQEIVALYQSIAHDLNPVWVHSGTSKTHIKKALDSLSGDGAVKSRIVVCVDMLGEGFDLPQLKVAAIHNNHKSLAVTLQFVGRFTRKAENVDDAAVVINIADATAEKSLEQLYSEGADWDHIISRLSEDRIDSELQLQEVIEDLKSHGTLHDKISLWNLNPRLSTQVYKTKCEVWNPTAYVQEFPESTTFWHSVSEKQNVLIAVAHVEASVKWGRYENLTESSYELLIAYWDKEKGILFMHSSDYDQMRVPSVAKAITDDQTELLNGKQIFRILNGVELPLAKSLGSSRIGAISFTSYFGPNVTEGLASVEISESELNNIVCLGYEAGEKVVWGGAQRKGKIWQVSSGSIDDWMNWCQGTLAKLQDDTGDESNITRDFLRPEPLERLHTAPPISVQWGEYLQSSFSDNLAVIFDDTEVPLHFVSLEIDDQTDADRIVFSIEAESQRSVYAFSIAADQERGFAYELLEGASIKFRVSKKITRDFDEQMYVDPFIFRYADGTFSYNKFHIPVDLGASNYSAEKIETWDWDGIPLNKESMGKGEDTQSIQYFTSHKIQEEFDIIFNDDGPGEAADLVGLKDVDKDEIRLCLVHCKNAKDGKVSRDIGNLYTVCGQAQKSISVKHGGMKKLSVDLRRRHERWSTDGYSRILKGDLRKLAYFVEKSRKAKITFEVVIVQPGLSKAQMTSDMGKLLSTTELFLKRTTEGDLRVIGSD